MSLSPKWKKYDNIYSIPTMRYFDLSSFTIVSSKENFFPNTIADYVKCLNNKMVTAGLIRGSNNLNKI